MKRIRARRAGGIQEDLRAGSRKAGSGVNEGHGAFPFQKNGTTAGPAR